MATRSSTFIYLPHLEDYAVHCSLFKDVENADFLREQLLQGNTHYEYAFLDATTIFSVNHALAAVFRAINDTTHGRLRSRNVHSEIVFSFSPNNNIAESFRRFGIQPQTKEVVAIKVVPRHTTGSKELRDPNGGSAQSTDSPKETNPSLEDPASHLAEVVYGRRVPFSDAELLTICDVQRIKKIYKLHEPVRSLLGNKTGGKGSHKTSKDTQALASSSHADDEADQVVERRNLEVLLLGMMALKGS